MVGHLFVGDVLGLFARHVAGSAIGVLVMMAGPQTGVAGEATAPVIAGSIFHSNRRVWIVAGGAVETVAAGALAGALKQRLPLAGGAASRTSLAAVFEVDRILEEVIAGLEGRQLVSLPDYGNFSFQMAFETDGIAPDWIEFRGIEDCSLAILRKML